MSLVHEKVAGPTGHSSVLERRCDQQQAVVTLKDPEDAGEGSLSQCWIDPGLVKILISNRNEVGQEATEEGSSVTGKCDEDHCLNQLKGYSKQGMAGGETHEVSYLGRTTSQMPTK